MKTIKEEVKELVYQITGKRVKDNCHLQGNADYQIAYTYLLRAYEAGKYDGAELVSDAYATM